MAGSRLDRIDAPVRRAVRAAFGVPWYVAAGGLLLLLVVLGAGYWWFGQRVEVSPGKLLILIRKVGKTLPSDGSSNDQVVLYPELLRRLGVEPQSTGFKGVLYAPRLEGRHFYDPFLWSRLIVDTTEIRQDEIGIRVRKYGRPLPPGRIVATEPDERGPLAEWLPPGRYAINPLAYDVLRIKPVVIPAGFVGVQTLLSGPDPENPNEYVVRAGERGVQPEVLAAGTYRLNPFLWRIEMIDTRSEFLHLHGDDVIRFPSADSFEIRVDCSVEYAVRQDMAPYVMVAFGDLADLKEKLILPQVRSLGRIEGSKLHAREFIDGEARTAFQNRVFDGLREQCYAQGVEVRAVLFREIRPPPEIADLIADRQIAGQDIEKIRFEIGLADAEAKLVEQQELQKQNKAVGEAQRSVVSVVKEAEQRREVAVIQARQRLEVARLKLQAAEQTAAALVSRGEAEAEVTRLTFEAQAIPLRQAVAAFGDGETYAQHFFYQKLAPALKSVLASTEGPFADVFRSLTSSALPKPAPPKSAAGAEESP